LLAAGGIPAHPTYFETLTLAAFEHFRAAAVDVAVVEVGLGGRLDATNASEPLVSAIVSIDSDHEEFLGTSLDAIAREKAGVLRPGRTTVVGPLAAAARAAVAAEAERCRARLVDAFEGVRLSVTAEERLELRTPAHAYAGLRPLPGAHQRANLVVAVRLLEQAAAAGLALDLDKVGDGIERTRWPGRLQWLAGPPPLLLDGAHNAAGAQALAEYLRGRRVAALVFAAMADKAVEEMAAALFPLARHVVLTRLPMKRAAATAELARRGGRFARALHRRARPREALALARSLAEPGEAVVVAGSLYLVGAVLGLLQREAGARPGPFGR
jgi:dihydrofolate synthase/folylpolyglutamate synthase